MDTMVITIFLHLFLAFFFGPLAMSLALVVQNDLVLEDLNWSTKSKGYLLCAWLVLLVAALSLLCMRRLYSLPSSLYISCQQQHQRIN